MNILMIIDKLSSGGKERRLVELLKGLAHYKDIKCELILLSDRIEYEQILSVDIKIHKLVRSSRKDPKIFQKINRICVEFRPDILQAWESMAAIYSIPIVKLRRIKFINAMITDCPPEIGFTNRRWMRAKFSFLFSDAIVANSNAGLRAYKPGIKGICIHNGFDPKRIGDLEDPNHVRQRLGIQTQYVVGMVAAFSQLKDYPTFLSAAKIILSKRRDVSFVCIGDGPELDEMKDFIPEDLNKNIIFTGRQDDIESIVNTFDVGALATITEGISNAIMEYMALGKAVVATDGGGTSELVIDNKTGFLVKQGDIKDFVQKVIELLEDHSVRERFGKNGKARIEQDFCLEKMTRTYVDLYQKVLE